MPHAIDARHFLFALAACCLTVLPTSAATLVTVDEALELAFPGAELERQSLFLSHEQLDRIESLSAVPGQAALVTRFVARRQGVVLGHAYLDTHRVRTLPETLLVVVVDDTVTRVEVVAFREPMDYLPPRGWYEQVEGRRLDEELHLKRGIRPITGATLTARATTDAVRRILAVHEVVAARPAEGS